MDSNIRIRSGAQWTVLDGFQANNGGIAIIHSRLRYHLLLFPL